MYRDDDPYLSELRDLCAREQTTAAARCRKLRDNDRLQRQQQ